MINDKTFKKKPKMKATAVLLGLLCLVFFAGTTGLNAQLCMIEDYYNHNSWTWSYAGPCTTVYNCLSYALGITDSWTWAWGESNPVRSQVDSFMEARLYYDYGNNSKIISYYDQWNTIGHFSKVTGSNTCRAKWGELNLINHGSWDPYSPGCSYGFKDKVYQKYNYMQVSIEGPTEMQYAGYYTWVANVSYGFTPYSYKWYFSGADYDWVLMSTQSYVNFTGLFDNDVAIDVEITDLSGRTAWDSIYVNVGFGGGGGGGGGGEPGDVGADSLDGSKTPGNKEWIASNVSNLMDEAKAKNINSSNPYDFIDSEFYREIIRMGPSALATLRKMILTSRENGLREYILAIAAERIAGVNLKKDTFAWINAKEFRRQWDIHMKMLATNVTTIIDSGSAIKKKNQELIKLGIPAIPYIMDEISTGKHEYRPAFSTLMKHATFHTGKSFDGDIKTIEQEHDDTIGILRDLASPTFK